MTNAVKAACFLLTVLCGEPVVPQTSIHQKWSFRFWMLAWDIKNKAHPIKELSSLPLIWRDGLDFHLDPLTAPSRHGSHHLCFSAFHSTGYGECLLNEPESRSYPLPPQLPGLLYDVNKQCELIFGPGSQVCPYMVSVWGPLLPLSIDSGCF